jgi:hypothetical protein
MFDFKIEDQIHDNGKIGTKNVSNFLFYFLKYVNILF